MTSTPLSRSAPPPPLDRVSGRPGSAALHRRSLAPVEHPAVDRRPVGRARHQPVEDIEFAHQDGPCRHPRSTDCTTSGRGPRLGRSQADARATASRGSCRFAPGMAGTNDQDVEHAGRLANLAESGNRLRRQRRVSRETSTFPSKNAEQRIEHIFHPGPTSQAIEGRRVPSEDVGDQNGVIGCGGGLYASCELQRDAPPAAD